MSPSSHSAVRSEPVDDIWATPLVAKDAGPSSIAGLATKVPKVKKSESQQERNRREILRSATVKCINFLLWRPSEAVNVWNAIECDLIPKAASGLSLAQGSAKKIAVSTFGKLTSNDLACWLVSLPGGPQKIILDLMDAKDPDSIQDTCTFLLQLRKHDVLPKSLNGDIRVLHRFLGRRLMQVGNRLVGFFLARLCLPRAMSTSRRCQSTCAIGVRSAWKV